jgi:DNA-directed RNA polymerase sigma subunit (sigma70/sigma32)
MNKLLDWEIYLTNNNFSITNSADRLEHSSVGKAFSAGWEAALESARIRISMSLDEVKEVKNVDATKIGNIPFTVRAYNCLRAEGIETIGDLLKYSERDLCRIPNMGRKSIKDIKEVLASMNLMLKAVEKTLSPAEKSNRDRLNSYTNECRKRRLGIYAQFKRENKTIQELADLHGISRGRIHQILVRAERDIKLVHDKLPPLESIKADAMRKPIPPWLREDQVNEPNND